MGSLGGGALSATAAAIAASSLLKASYSSAGLMSGIRAVSQSNTRRRKRMGRVDLPGPRRKRGGYGLERMRRWTAAKREYRLGGEDKIETKSGPLGSTATTDNTKTTLSPIFHQPTRRNSALITHPHVAKFGSNPAPSPVTDAPALK